jgi:hypothetical protein
MKTLSVLFTLALMLAANQLAARLKQAHALPAAHTVSANTHPSVPQQTAQLNR